MDRQRDDGEVQRHMQRGLRASGDGQSAVIRRLIKPLPRQSIQDPAFHQSAQEVLVRPAVLRRRYASVTGYDLHQGGCHGDYGNRAAGRRVCEL